MFPKACSISSIKCIIGRNIRVIFLGFGSQTSFLSDVECPCSFKNVLKDKYKYLLQENKLRTQKGE